MENLYFGIGGSCHCILSARIYILRICSVRTVYIKCQYAVNIISPILGIPLRLSVYNQWRGGYKAHSPTIVYTCILYCIQYCILYLLYCVCIYTILYSTVVYNIAQFINIIFLLRRFFICSSSSQKKNRIKLFTITLSWGKNII